MDFPYTQILKQAYELTKTQKFLWLFGLFLIWGQLLNFGAALGDGKNEQYKQQSGRIMDWVATHPGTAVGLLAGLLLLIFVMVLVNYRSKAGLIISVDGILNKQEVGFRKGFKLGGLYYVRLIGTAIILGLVMLLVMVILTAPIVYLLISGFAQRAILLGLLGLCIFIPVSILITFLSLLSSMFICLYDQKISESLRSASSLIAKKWVILLIFSVMLWVALMIAFFAGLFVVFLSVLPFAFFSEMLVSGGDWYASGAVFGLGIMVSGLIFLSFLAILSAFHLTAWVLAFRELVKPVKLDEAEAAVAPELV